MNLASEIRAHRFPVFCDVLETGPEIHWRRDYRTGIETGLRYFRLILTSIPAAPVITR